MHRWAGPVTAPGLGEMWEGGGLGETVSISAFPPAAHGQAALPSHL